MSFTVGAEDVKRQALNVYRMKLLGATVVPVESGSKTLKDAMNEAMRDWVTNVDNTFYIIGTAAGPHQRSSTGSRLPMRHWPQARCIPRAKQGICYLMSCRVRRWWSNASSGLSTCSSKHRERAAMYGVEAGGYGVEIWSTCGTTQRWRAGVLQWQLHTFNGRRKRSDYRNTFGIGWLGLSPWRWA